MMRCCVLRLNDVRGPTDKRCPLQVCVPINPDNAEDFDPVHGVPTVSQLLMELDQSDIDTTSADMQVSSA